MGNVQTVDANTITPVETPVTPVVDTPVNTPVDTPVNTPVETPVDNTVKTTKPLNLPCPLFTKQQIANIKYVVDTFGGDLKYADPEPAVEAPQNLTSFIAPIDKLDEEHELMGVDTNQQESDLIAKVHRCIVDHEPLQFTSLNELEILLLVVRKMICNVEQYRTKYPMLSTNEIRAQFQEVERQLMYKQTISLLRIKLATTALENTKKTALTAVDDTFVAMCERTKIAEEKARADRVRAIFNSALAAPPGSDIISQLTA